MARNPAGDIGDDLVYEILLRLPAKSAIRSGAVCKAWRCITTDPAFISGHARRRPLEALMYTTLISPSGKIVDLELDALPVGVHHPSPAIKRRRLARFPKFRNPDTGARNEQYSPLLASLDGLLLLKKGVGHYVVCNPATRRWAELPRLSNEGRSFFDGHLECGFYFHPPSGEYRLLCHSAMGLAAHYVVLSVGADEPRRLDVETTTMEQYHATLGIKIMAPAALHGRLHWLLHPESGDTDKMVAFDTVAETFRRMTPPPVTRKPFADLLASDGSLMASEFTDTSVDLWVLEGYGAMDERWELRHRVVLPWQVKRPQLVVGGDVDGDVIMGTSGGLAVYNVKSKTVRVVVNVESPAFLHLSRNLFRESMVQHAFFNDRERNCLRLFRF